MSQKILITFVYSFCYNPLIHTYLIYIHLKSIISLVIVSYNVLILLRRYLLLYQENEFYEKVIILVYEAAIYT